MENDPQGQFIYYFGGVSEPPAELRRVPVTGAPETAVRDGDALVILPAMGTYAPVSDGLYFLQISSKTSQFELRRLDYRTQRSFALGELSETKRHRFPMLEISPDGREVLYVPDRRHESDIVLVENFK
jgi:hypothetical protein